MNDFIPNKKVLFVDDEENLLNSFISLMRKEDVDVHILQDSTQIDSMLSENGPFALVLSDQRMPGLNGAELLAKVALKNPETIRVLVTGYSDYNETVQAINSGGISQYISKPWDDDKLKEIINLLVKQYNLENENKFLFNEIKLKNSKLTELLDGTILNSTHLLVDILSYINPNAAAQTEKVKELGLPILDKINNLSHQDIWEIKIALDLFNLGIAILPTWVQIVLNKEGLDSISRFEVSKDHQLLAAKLLEEIPGFEGVAKIIKFSNKNWDGSGTPEEIEISKYKLPIGARLLKILLDFQKLQFSNYKDIELLKSMAKRPNKYDLDLLQLIIKSYTIKKSIKIKQIKVFSKELKPGMIVLDTIRTLSGVKLINPNTILTNTSITAIKSWERFKDKIEPINVEVKVLDEE